jgi:hypothetical protein
LFTLIDSGISIVKENSISAITACAEAAGDSLAKYLPEMVPLLFKIFEAFSSKEYRSLRGTIIECLSIISIYV